MYKTSVLLKLFSLAAVVALLFLLSLPAAFADNTNSITTVDLPVAFAPESSNATIFSSNADLAFAASFQTDSLFAFDPITGAQLGAVTVGDGPSYITLAESGAQRIIAVANTAFIGSPIASVTFVDATTPARMNIISRVLLPRKYSLDSSDRTLTLTADGSTAFIVARASSGKATLFSVAVASGEIVDQFNLGSGQYFNAALALNGTRILLAASGGAPSIDLIDITAARALKLAARIRLSAGFARENNFALNTAGNVAFIASADAGQLYAIDLTSNRISAQINAGNFPAGLDLIDTGDSIQLAVTAIFDSNVNVFRATGGTNLTRVSSYHAPVQFLTTAPALSRDGHGFVATRFGQQLFTFDLATGRQLAAVALDTNPENLVAIRRADSTRLAIIDALRHQLLFFQAGIDGNLALTTNSDSNAAAGFRFTNNILFNHDGSRIFTASPLSDELLIIDADRAAVTTRIKVGLRPERIALVEAAGITRIAVININSATISLIAIDDSGAQISGTVKLPDATVLPFINVAFAPDCKLGYVSDGRSQLLAFDAASGEIIDKLAIGAQPVGIAISQQGDDIGTRWLAVILQPDDEPATIKFVSANGSLQETARFQTNSSIRFALNDLPLFSSDGQTLFVTASLTLELLSINTSNGKLISRAKGFNAPALVPVSSSNNGNALLAVNVGATPLVMIETDNIGNFGARHKLKPPKGSFFTVGNNAVVNQSRTRIYVADYQSGQLLIFDRDSSALLDTISLGAGPAGLAISADGSRIAVLNTNGAANSISIIGIQPQQ